MLVKSPPYTQHMTWHRAGGGDPGHHFCELTSPPNNKGLLQMQQTWSLPAFGLFCSTLLCGIGLAGPTASSEVDANNIIIC